MKRAGCLSFCGKAAPSPIVCRVVDHGEADPHGEHGDSGSLA